LPRGDRRASRCWSRSPSRSRRCRPSWMYKQVYANQAAFQI
jgi:hypothetical protein